MEPGGSMLHAQDLYIIPILSHINPIPPIDTYLFKIHSNMVLQSMPRLPRSLFSVHQQTTQLMEHGGSMLHAQDLYIIPILSHINPIPPTDTYLFKIHSNMVLQSMPRPSQKSLPCRLTNSMTYETRSFNAAFTYILLRGLFFQA